MNLFCIWKWCRNGLELRKDILLSSRDSSVGRASDRRSEGPRFDPGSRHFLIFLHHMHGHLFIHSFTRSSKQMHVKGTTFTHLCFCFEWYAFACTMPRICLVNWAFQLSPIFLAWACKWKSCFLGCINRLSFRHLWSSGYDVSLTRWRSPVRSWPGVFHMIIPRNWQHVHELVLHLKMVSKWPWASKRYIVIKPR